MTDTQTKKPQYNVAVIGTGGIGSYLAEGLAKALQFQAPMSALTLIDGDSFEPKNMARQNFSTYGNKAVQLAEEWAEKYANIFLLPQAAWVVSDEVAANYDSDEDEDDNTVARIPASKIVKENSWIFCTVDNNACRRLVFEEAAKLNNVDVFTGGNGDVQSGDPLFGYVYHYQRRDGQDVTLSPLVFHPEIANPSTPNPGELSCQERAALEGGTQLLAVNMQIASQLLAKVAQVMFGGVQEKEDAMQMAEIYVDMSCGLSKPYDRRPQPAVQQAPVLEVATA